MMDLSPESLARHRQSCEEAMSDAVEQLQRPIPLDELTRDEFRGPNVQ